MNRRVVATSQVLTREQLWQLAVDVEWVERWRRWQFKSLDLEMAQREKRFQIQVFKTGIAIKRGLFAGN